MTALGLLFVVAWGTGIVVTAVGLRGRRSLPIAVGAGIFVGTTVLVDEDGHVPGRSDATARRRRSRPIGSGRFTSPTRCHAHTGPWPDHPGAFPANRTQHLTPMRPCMSPERAGWVATTTESPAPSALSCTGASTERRTRLGRASDQSRTPKNPVTLLSLPSSSTVTKSTPSTAAVFSSGTRAHANRSTSR